MKWKIRVYKQKVVGKENNVLLSGFFLNYRNELVHEGDISSEYDVESFDSFIGEMRSNFCSERILNVVNAQIKFKEEVTSTVEKHIFADQGCCYLIKLYGVNPQGDGVYIMEHEYCPWAIETRRFSPEILNGVSRIVHGFKRDEIEMMMKYLA